MWQLTEVALRSMLPDAGSGPRRSVRRMAVPGSPEGTRGPQQTAAITQHGSYIVIVPPVLSLLAFRRPSFCQLCMCWQQLTCCHSSVAAIMVHTHLCYALLEAYALSV